MVSISLNYYFHTINGRTRIDKDDPTNIVVKNLQVLTSLRVKADEMKDSVDHNYYGDKEKISEEEFDIVNSLGKEKLLRAYAG